MKEVVPTHERNDAAREMELLSDPNKRSQPVVILANGSEATFTRT
jgi:hypothetical protein